MNIRKQLELLADSQFHDFNAKLIPNINKDTVLGVKTPQLKKLAKELIKSGEYQNFLRTLPHDCFEENQLHAFIISEIKDFDMAVLQLEHFLPYIDNWATCDQLVMKAAAKAPEKMLGRIDVWLQSENTYTVRFAIGFLMRYFLDARFDEKYLEKVADIEGDEYYVNMMSAWYFATALANGMDVKTLSSIIGHVSSQTTLDIYLHSTHEMQRQAATKIEQGIGKNDGVSAEDKETPDQDTNEPCRRKFEAAQGKIRRAGTGCITKINDNLYEGRYSPRGADGKRISKNIYVKTREECERLLAEMIPKVKAEIAEAKAMLKASQSA